MKRMHVHVGVDDLERSAAFYTRLFGAEPIVHKDDYAKWMLDDPQLNFAISTGRGAAGVQHLGIETGSGAELAEVAGRLEAAGGPIVAEAEAACCYARSRKNWIADPQGLVWETFFTHGETTTYGSSPDLGALAAPAGRTGCCR